MRRAGAAVLTSRERELFVKAVRPLYDEARQRFGDETFRMAGIK